MESPRDYLEMDELTRRVLRLFIEMRAESLDVRTLFEAGGNDRSRREAGNDRRAPAQSALGLEDPVWHRAGFVEHIEA